MISLHVEKLYRYPRLAEHMSVTVPFKRGALTDISKVRVYDGEKPLPVQCKVTARYFDQSVKYLFVRFVGDLPGNEEKVFQLDPYGEKDMEYHSKMPICGEERLAEASMMEAEADGYRVSNGLLCFQVKNNTEELFEVLEDGCRVYEKECFAGPFLECREGEVILPCAKMQFGTWSVVEQGPLCVILKNQGVHTLSKNDNTKREISFETKLTLWAGKPWIEVSYRLINTSDEELDIATLGFYYRASVNSESIAKQENFVSLKNFAKSEIAENSEKIKKNIRTCTGYANYRTNFTVSEKGEAVEETVTAERVLMQQNEHYAEVFYGTFFADRTDKKSGICATIYQAQQNFPKAVKADREGLAVMLVPRGEDRVVMQSGMSREQRFLLHFHGSAETLDELNNRSLIYQMPDRPIVEPQVFKESGVMPDIFPEKQNPDTEILLISKADGHNRVFGMLNWGDTYDANYSSQGRGGGRPVWLNNEYDFPHACTMMYARTGMRRYLDYLLVSASHWMDVDICHYSQDPLRLGGQIEHTRGHVVGGKIVVSHEWVEGLLDYYHFTGDERGLESAIGIGENVLRLLEIPVYAQPGEVSARETGWALRTLTALYEETGEERWLTKCEWIVRHFHEWEEKYGYWLSPYTDNTLIRVGFMIAVAVGSLMRYYRVRPNEELREMMLREIDDLVENCRMDNGLFYYKELPSLTRLGNNTLILEALAIGYELTGEKKYLEAGLTTYRYACREISFKFSGQRTKVEDAVIFPGDSGKNFAQSFLPLASFDRALEKAEMR